MSTAAAATTSNKSQTKPDVAAAGVDVDVDQGASYVHAYPYSPVMDVSPDYNNNKIIDKDELEFRFVQDFHKTVRSSAVLLAPNKQQQSQVFTMSFDRPHNFVIKIAPDTNSNNNNNGSNSNHNKNKDTNSNTIALLPSSESTSNGAPKPWFKIARVEGLLILTNMKGEPFLMIRESPCDKISNINNHSSGGKSNGMAMDLYRYNPLAMACDNAQRKHQYQQEQLFCRVRRKYCRKERKFRWRKSKYALCIGYFIELMDPFDKHQSFVECHGCWPNFVRFIGDAAGASDSSSTRSDNSNNNGDNNNTTNNDGANTTSAETTTEFASIRKQFLHTNKWRMTVSAGQDVVLFLGIACALELLERKANEQFSISTSCGDVLCCSF
uniref:Uncharacterized protein n=1 Tax=Pseudo-nitzschia australis TaxID=44445 RepID=A0A7S4APA0_9STRA